MQAAHLVEEGRGGPVLAPVDRGDEQLEHQPVDMRPGGEQEVVLHGVEDVERIAAGVEALAQPADDAVEGVLLAPLEQRELVTPVEQADVLVTTGDVTIEELCSEGDDEPLTAEALAERIGDIAPREDEF